jgi:hypothetical protein
MECNKLPTGFLFTDEYSNGRLETLSIGDYGREHNIKADFLGYTGDFSATWQDVLAGCTGLLRQLTAR